MAFRFTISGDTVADLRAAVDALEGNASAEQTTSSTRGRGKKNTPTAPEPAPIPAAPEPVATAAPTLNPFAPGAPVAPTVVPAGAPALNPFAPGAPVAPTVVPAGAPALNPFAPGAPVAPSTAASADAFNVRPEVEKLVARIGQIVAQGGAPMKVEMTNWITQSLGLSSSVTYEDALEVVKRAPDDAIGRMLELTGGR
jgi:hypothetical protein